MIAIAAQRFKFLFRLSASDFMKAVQIKQSYFMHFDFFTITVAISASFIAMLSGGFWGLGGGWLIMPVLLLCGVNMELAVTASLLQMVVSTFPTVARQVKSIGWSKKSWGIYAALPMCVASFIGSIAGEPLGDFLESIFKSRVGQELVFIALLATICYQSIMLKAGAAAKGNEPGHIGTREKIYTALSGFFTGVISSLVGIGGGTLVRPVLRNLLKAPEEITGKISRLSVFLVALSGGVCYLLASGQPPKAALELAGVLVIGGLPGFTLGAKMHGIVIKAGMDLLAGRSFAFFLFLVMSSLICKVSGYHEAGRIIVCSSSVAILIFLTTVTVIALKKLKEAEKKS